MISFVLRQGNLARAPAPDDADEHENNPDVDERAVAGQADGE
jgi:hypothetical protein